MALFLIAAALLGWFLPWYGCCCGGGILVAVASLFF